MEPHRVWLALLADEDDEEFRRHAAGVEGLDQTVDGLDQGVSGFVVPHEFALAGSRSRGHRGSVRSRRKTGAGLPVLSPSSRMPCRSAATATPRWSTAPGAA